MNSFTYVAVRSVDEALASLAEHGDEAKVLAGGTGLVNMMKQRLVNPEVVLDIGRLPHLDGIAFDGSDVRLGALCRQQDLATSPELQAALPLLSETFRQVATVRVRNMATVGGSLVHGDPNQDPAVALLCLDARVTLRSSGGSRTVPLAEFLIDYYETTTRPDELLTEVSVPLPSASSGWAYLKFLPRTADDYATVSAAALLSVAGKRITDVRLAFGSAAPTQRRCLEAEAMLRGQEPSVEAFRAAAETARGLADPVSDGRGSAAYKTDMVVVFVRRALERALERAKAA